MNQLNEPHQRTQSGKLRTSSKQPSNNTSGKVQIRKEIVYTGVENATKLGDNDPDDEMATYYQTPTELCNIQVDILRQMAKGYGVDHENCIDTSLRRTWNIGAWHIGNNMSISINLRQPNIFLFWASIRKVDVDVVESIASKYNAEKLERSSCLVKGYGTTCQVQGRWTPYVIEELKAKGYITDNKPEIINLNIGQTSLFCLVVMNTGSKYLGRLTKESVTIIVRYLPEWCKDIAETNSGGATTLRISDNSGINDATQLTISDMGDLQYQGKPNNLEKLPKALSIAIHNMIKKNIHTKLFMESLKYSII